MTEQVIDFLTADPSGLAVQLFLMGTMIFMIRDKQKPPLMTSIPTAIALIILALGGSFRAPVMATCVFISGLLWFVLAYQRFAQRTTPVHVESDKR